MRPASHVSSRAPYSTEVQQPQWRTSTTYDRHNLATCANDRHRPKLYATSSHRGGLPCGPWPRLWIAAACTCKPGAVRQWAWLRCRHGIGAKEHDGTRARGAVCAALECPARRAVGGRPARNDRLRPAWERGDARPTAGELEAAWLSWKRKHPPAYQRDSSLLVTRSRRYARLVTGDQIRDTTFLIGGRGYDVAQVDDLLRRVAEELDHGRAAGPLIRTRFSRRRTRDMTSAPSTGSWGSCSFSRTPLN